MPRIAEVLFYLRGLWLLFKADPAHARYLDFTDRGVARSFWALAYSFPLMVASELVSLTRLVQPAVDISVLVVLRTALVQGLSWMAPLVVIGVICVIANLPRAFLKIIVATNWLSLPVNIFAALAIFLIATGLQPFVTVILLVFQTVLLGAFLFEIRIVYMLMGEKVLPTAAAIMTSAITALLVTDMGTRYIIGA